MSGHGRMSPAFRAAWEYRRLPGDFTFDEAVEAHFVCGYVVATPEIFILARPVERAGAEADILNPTFQFGNPDAWFIYLMAGRVDYCWQYYPVPYQWAGWQRRGKALRFYSMDQIQRKARHGIKT